ncbi:hypothetical protein ACLOJK_026134 [Asimina triloba]
MAKFLFAVLVIVVQLAGLVLGGSRSGSVDIMDGHCSRKNDSECSMTGGTSPPHHLSSSLIAGEVHPALLAINSFAKGDDINGGGPSECDNQYHSDNEMVVALSTGLYNGRSRCLKNIWISANGRYVLAEVVDEYDSVNGGTKDDRYRNVVVASPAVLKALDIPESAVRIYDITWSDD